MVTGVGGGGSLPRRQTKQELPLRALKIRQLLAMWVREPQSTCDKCLNTFSQKPKAKSLLSQILAGNVPFAPVRTDPWY